MLMLCFCKNRYKYWIKFFNLNYSYNFQGFLCISVDNCFIFCGTLFGHLSSLAYVCYGGLPKRSQSDKVCYVPCQNWSFWTFLTFLGRFWIFDIPYTCLLWGDFQRGLRVIRYVPCQNCQPRLFKAACQNVIFHRVYQKILKAMI